MGNNSNKNKSGSGASNEYQDWGYSEDEQMEINQNNYFEMVDMYANWSDELPYLTEALRDSPYEIVGVETSEFGGARDTVTIRHRGTGEGDDGIIQIERGAIRNLSFNTDEGLPDLRTMLQKVDANIPFRELKTLRLTLYRYSQEGFDINTGIRRRGDTVEFDTAHLSDISQEEFNDIMDDVLKI